MIMGVLFCFGLFAFLLTVVESKEPMGNFSCAFETISKCYQNISSVGANFTAEYVPTPVKVCENHYSSNNEVKCLRNETPNLNRTCKIFLNDSDVTKLDTYLNKICKDNKDWLNVSKCYNNVLIKRKECFAKFKANTTDNKALCCENFKTINCTYDAVKKNCTKANVTSLEIYDNIRSVQNTICQPFKKECSGTTTSSAFLPTIFMAVFTTLTYSMRE